MVLDFVLLTVLGFSASELHTGSTTCEEELNEAPPPKLTHTSLVRGQPTDSLISRRPGVSLCTFTKVLLVEPLIGFPSNSFLSSLVLLLLLFCTSAQLFSLRLAINVIYSFVGLMALGETETQRHHQNEKRCLFPDARDSDLQRSLEKPAQVSARTIRQYMPLNANVIVSAHIKVPTDSH